MSGLLDYTNYGLEIDRDRRLSYTATNHDLLILRGDSLEFAIIVGIIRF